MILVVSRFVIRVGFVVRVWDFETGEILLRDDAVQWTHVLAIREDVARTYYDRPVHFLEVSADQVRVAGD
jgi:hypothetical protein